MAEGIRWHHLLKLAARKAAVTTLVEEQRPGGWIVCKGKYLPHEDRVIAAVMLLDHDCLDPGEHVLEHSHAMRIAMKPDTIETPLTIYFRESTREGFLRR